jgi:putative protein kinase ArgK-like GTPase of G3E family
LDTARCGARSKVTGRPQLMTVTGYPGAARAPTVERLLAQAATRSTMASAAHVEVLLTRVP